MYKRQVVKRATQLRNEIQQDELAIQKIQERLDSLKRIKVGLEIALNNIQAEEVHYLSEPVFSFRTFLTEECFEMVHYAEPGKKPKWGYFPSEGHPEVVTKFEGTKATPEFLQAIAYEVYVKNVTFGLLHQWLTDMGMTISKNTLRNWLKKGKKYLDVYKRQGLCIAADAST